MTFTRLDVLATAQTFLFVPGDRPERFDKAVGAGPDVVIIDLEDAVAPHAKEIARAHVRTWLNRGNAAMVRVNSAETAWHDADIAMAVECGAPIMLPKTEDVSTLSNVIAVCGVAAVVPLLETATGIVSATAIAAAPGVARLAFGSLDLAAQLGVDPDAREVLLYARSALVTASAAACLAPPIDGVTTSVTDTVRVHRDAAYARRLGMTAKLCIHPDQIDSARAALAPSDREVSWANAVLEAVPDGEPAVSVGGSMVDAPVIRRARQILEANSNGSRHPSPLTQPERK